MTVGNDPAQPGGAIAPKVSKFGIDQFDNEEFSLTQAIGGWRGVAESVTPVLAFVITFTLTSQLLWAIGAALGVALLFGIVRLAQRQSLMQVVFGGLTGVGVSALWAWFTGEAVDFYTLGLVINILYGLGFLISIMVRRPLVPWLIALATARHEWRSEPVFYRRGVIATWVWVGLFVIRLAIQLPLYYGGFATALGIARIALGVPGTAVVAWVTWLLMRNLKKTPEPSTDPVT